jgi:hypothetical protein
MEELSDLEGDKYKRMCKESLLKLGDIVSLISFSTSSPMMLISSRYSLSSLTSDMLNLGASGYL